MLMNWTGVVGIMPRGIFILFQTQILDKMLKALRKISLLETPQPPGQQKMQVMEQSIVFTLMMAIAKGPKVTILGVCSTSMPVRFVQANMLQLTAPPGSQKTSYPTSLLCYCNI